MGTGFFGFEVGLTGGARIQQASYHTQKTTVINLDGGFIKFTSNSQDSALQVLQ